MAPPLKNAHGTDSDIFAPGSSEVRPQRESSWSVRDLVPEFPTALAPPRQSRAPFDQYPSGVPLSLDVRQDDPAG